MSLQDFDDHNRRSVQWIAMLGLLAAFFDRRLRDKETNLFISLSLVFRVGSRRNFNATSGARRMLRWFAGLPQTDPQTPSIPGTTQTASRRTSRASSDGRRAR